MNRASDQMHWALVKFGDVVKDVNETVRDPVAAGLERFVGLEHLDPENLHVRRWGLLAETEVTFKKRFRKGQVLFGKRRAYQRKVAVAEFDGICSSDILTFEPKGDELIPELLPFIVQSDGFFAYALGTSAGSLSPRTRWPQLKDYGFPLPPKDEQRRIADILRAGDEVVDLWQSCFDAITDTIAAIRDCLSHGHGEWPRLRLADVCRSISKGESPKWQGFAYCSSGVRFVTSENVLRDELRAEPAKFIPDDFHEKLVRSSVEAGDVLVTLVGGSLGRACLVPEAFGPANVNQAVAVVKVDADRALPEFVLSCLQSPTGYERLLSARVETFKANISLTTIRNFTIPVPSLSVQSRFCEAISQLKSRKSSIAGVLGKARLLKRELMRHQLEVTRV